MTKFFMKWWVNVELLPKTPQEVGKLQLAMLEAVKADLSDRRWLDWGLFGSGASGYLISEMSEQDIFGKMLKFKPVIGFELSPVLSVDQAIDETKKAAAASGG
jgi:hypothetical protein